MSLRKPRSWPRADWGLVPGERNALILMPTGGDDQVSWRGEEGEGTASECSWAEFWEERLVCEMLTYLCSRSQPGLPTAYKVPKLFGRSQGFGLAPIQLVDDDVVEDEQFGLWSSMSEVFLE